MAKPELRIPQTDTPTIFNKDALIGMAVAAIVSAPIVYFGMSMVSADALRTAASEVMPTGSVSEGMATLLTNAGSKVLTTGRIIASIAMATGGLIGGSMGKMRMEEEVRKGKKVSTPTLFNKDVLAYGLGIPLAIGLATTAVGTVLPVPIPTIIAVPIALAQMSSVVIGAAYGAIAGKARMQQDYDQALGDLQAQNQSQSVAIQKAQEQLVGVSQELSNGKSFVAAEEQRRTNPAIVTR